MDVLSDGEIREGIKAYGDWPTIPQLYIGGELVGGSFRTDRNANIRPGKLNGAQVDFSDYRAGLGLTYGVSDNVSFDLGAGISFQRQFDFGRAGETYRTDPSPYVRMQMSASF